MGAYFKGSINKLCKFVNPKHGIITAIGQAHYEYFKTQEIVASTKFELGEYVTKNKGTLIINANQIEEKFIPNNMPLVRVGRNSDIYFSNVVQTKDGLSLKFHNKDNIYQVDTKIYGIHQATNIVLAIEMALQLGMPINTILSTLKTLPQVNHRLEVLRRENGVIIIDNAYNSNFDGFKSGLELLQTLDNGRKILITPGMVELGKLHDKLHYEIGKFAGERVDIVIVILPKRIKTFIKGFNETCKKETQLIEIKSFKEAQKWMNDNLKTGDVVLLENDLPDIYETNINL
jgi:UDP-N-acetylmuramoyl-tripeptide--D-alanyl-D-alanine ligase